MKKFRLAWLFLPFVACNTQDSSEKPREVAQYSIDQFYKSSAIFSGDLDAADTALLVSSNETGIFNAWVINLVNGNKRQLTHSTKESIFADAFVPGTSNIIYEADKGGNENSHLYLLKPDGSTRDLTPGEKEKAGFGGWSRDQQHLYYESNRRNPQFFDYYKMDTSTWTGTLLYQNDKGFNVGALSADENLLALSESITTSSNNLYILNRASGQLKKVNSDSIECINSPITFSLDGKYLYYLTDDDGEFTYIARYDIATGKKEKFYSDKWDVVWMKQSYNEKYRVIYVNADGRNELHLFDAASNKEIDFPSIPDGSISGVSISRSEKKMILTVNSSKAPGNLYSYDFETRELKRLTNTLNPEIKEEDLVSAQVVRYKSFDGLEIPAIYYKPHQASEKNKVPAVVFVHGGPGGQAGQYYFSLVQLLVNHGYAVLDVNNRGSSGYGKTFFKMDNRNHGDKDLKDVVWGKKYLQSLPYIDSSKIGILGGSYGGYMTLAAMCFHPDEFKTGVDLFGVANWLRTLKEIPPYWASFRKALYEEIGDPNTEDTIRLKQYSPLLHAGKIKKPLMVLQGANDPRVLKIESDEVVEAVKKNNVPVEYVVFPDEGHGFMKKENEIKGYGEILSFLDKYLKEEKPASGKE